MTISIIAAIGPKRELGKSNKLLWHIPEDMKRFKQLTSGHAVIMGQKTFESIGKLLPDRTNIILSHDVEKFKKKYQQYFRHSGTKRDYPESDSGCAQKMSGLTRMTGIVVVSSIDEAIHEANRVKKEEIFIIGGGMIYKQFLPLADKLYLTIVEPIDKTYKIDADTFFPVYSMFNKTISKESLNTEKYKLTFLELERA